MEYKSSLRWYQKFFIILFGFSFLFMFVGASLGHSRSMHNLDVGIGLAQPKLSESRQWLKKMLFDGVRVDAQLPVINVLDEARKIALQLVYGFIANAIQSIANAVIGLVNQIAQAADVYDSIRGQTENLRKALYTQMFSQAENLLSSNGIISRLTRGALGPTQQQNLVSAFQRARFARGVNRFTQNPSSTNVSESDLGEATRQLTEAVAAVNNSASTSNDPNAALFRRFNGYNPGNSTEVETALEAAVTQDVSQVVSPALENLQNSAPADCKVGYVIFEGASEISYSTGEDDDNNQPATNNPQLSDVRVNTNLETFLEQTEGIAETYELATLSPDACSSIQATATVTAGALGVDAPSPTEEGFNGVVEALSGFINQLVREIARSFVRTVFRALNAAFRSMPRIFSQQSALFNGTQQFIATEVDQFLDDIEINF